MKKGCLSSFQSCRVVLGCVITPSCENAAGHLLIVLSSDNDGLLRLHTLRRSLPRLHTQAIPVPEEEDPAPLGTLTLLHPMAPPSARPEGLQEPQSSAF